ncbi:MAG: hypothetical protein ACTSP9_19035 [Promethearchaeota archaeon]
MSHYINLSEFIRKRTTLIVRLILTINIITACIIIITLVVPIPDDPPIYHFPFMVYIEYGLAKILLLFLISGVLLKKKGMTFKAKIGRNKIITSLIDKIEWEDKPSLWRRVLMSISIIAFLFATLGFGLLFLVIPVYWFSPMNLLYLPFVFCMILLWTCMGVKKENIRIVLYSFLLLGLLMCLDIAALIIAQDQLVLPLAISYQVVTLFLIALRLIIHVLVERKKE